MTTRWVVARKIYMKAKVPVFFGLGSVVRRKVFYELVDLKDVHPSATELRNSRRRRIIRSGAVAGGSLLGVMLFTYLYALVPQASTLDLKMFYMFAGLCFATTSILYSSIALFTLLPWRLKSSNRREVRQCTLNILRGKYPRRKRYKIFEEAKWSETIEKPTFRDWYS